jgi:hypothetical protein
LNIHTRTKLAFKADEESNGRITSLEIYENTIYLGVGTMIRMLEIQKIRDKSLNFTTFAFVFDKEDGENDDCTKIRLF